MEGSETQRRGASERAEGLSRRKLCGKIRDKKEVKRAENRGGKGAQDGERDTDC